MGLRKAILDQQNALHELLNSIQGTNYAHAVLQSNKTIDHAEGSGFGPRRLKFISVRRSAVNRSPVIVRPSLGSCGKGEKLYQPGRLRRIFRQLELLTLSRLHSRIQFG